MNHIYVLILMLMGPTGHGNSNALTVAEFYSKDKCEAAGRAAKKLHSTTLREVKYVCVKK
jgi:hypothetical protein